MKNYLIVYKQQENMWIVEEMDSDNYVPFTVSVSQNKEEAIESAKNYMEIAGEDYQLVIR